jgi:sugar/nucleoside kinase (ribokinase family)
VVGDLLEGRFDSVPYSILSGTQMRHFTRQTLEDLFEASGYTVASVATVSIPPSPAGVEKLKRLAAIPGASEDLSAAEFLVTANPARS